MSKGDILLEPAEILIELVGRLLVKLVPRTIPEEPISQWGPVEWLWVDGVFVLIVIMAWAIRRLLQKRRVARISKRKLAS